MRPCKAKTEKEIYICYLPVLMKLNQYSSIYTCIFCIYQNQYGKYIVADERSIRQKNTIMSLRYWHVLLFNKYIFYMSFIDTLLKSDHGQFLM